MILGKFLHEFGDIPNQLWQEGLVGGIFKLQFLTKAVLTVGVQFARDENVTCSVS